MDTKQLLLVMNGKGGVGKSFFATNFVQHLKDRDIAHRAIDTDDENSTLSRFHPDADFVDLADTRELDRIFAAFEDSKILVVDCRAASTDLFLDYFREIDVFAVLRELRIALTVVCPVNHEADSLEQLRVIADALEGNCRYLIVKNESHSTQFRLYENSQIRDKILTDYGAQELTMRKLSDWLVTGLNEAGVTASKAVHGTEFSLIDRQRLKNWVTHFESEVEGTVKAFLSTSQKSKAKNSKPKDS
jgi:RecA/RadA recombinase